METKRLLLFLIGCIGLRIVLVYLAYVSNLQHLRYMGYLAFLVAAGFFYIFLTNSRKTGPEVFGDKIWWDNLRPVHGLLYLLFAYNAVNGNKNAWMYLLVDVVIGLMSFLVFHGFISKT